MAGMDVRAIIAIGFAAGLVGAGAGGVAVYQVASRSLGSSEPFTREVTDVATLIAQWERASQDCQGLPGRSKAGDTACALALKTDRRLNRMGYCFSAIEPSGWHACPS